MTATQFVSQIDNASPRNFDYDKLNEWSVEENARAYLCQERPAPLGLPSVAGSEQLIELFNRWDPSTIEVGSFDFLERPQTIGQGLHIGNYILDPIVILPSGELAAFDLEESETEPQMLVAENGNKYLDALLISAEYLAQCYADAVACDDMVEESQATAEQSARAAGGEKYLKIYLDNFGVNDDDD